MDKVLKHCGFVWGMVLLILVGCTSQKSINMPVVSGEKEATGEFITDWVVLDAVQWQGADTAFEAEFKKELPVNAADIWQSYTTGSISLGDTAYSWRALSSPTEIVDLGAALGRVDNAYSFLSTTVRVDESGARVLAVGSDDAVKVWLNGKLVHENLTLRGVVPDQDWIPLLLEQGDNQLLVQVFNASLGWAMSARMLTEQQVVQGFADQVVQMPIEKVQVMLASGIDINQKNALGLTALHIAKQKRDKAREQWILDRGGDASIKAPDGDKLVKTYLHNGIKSDLAGASYLIVNNGNIIARGGLGFADLENTKPINTKTKFRIGSVTKQFTAAAIMKLAESGKLSLDDQLDKYWPEFPKAEQVSIRHLLNHTSGITSYTQAKGFWDTPEKNYSRQEMLSLIQSLGYDFDPGSRFTYSNSGYYLLGLIIEDVSGLSLAEFYKQELLEPLKMFDSGIYQNGKVADNEAIGRRLENGQVVAAADTHVSQPAAAGAMYSTVEDLYLWNQALHNGRVISREYYEQMISPGRLNDGKAFDAYGFGVGLGDFQGKKAISHGGGIHGFSSFVGAIPEQGYHYFMLTNMISGHTTFNGNPFLKVAELISMDTSAQVSE